MTQALKLRGKTPIGKRHVLKQGDIWNFVEACDSVPFSDTPGSWALVQSQKDRAHVRWVNMINDINFVIATD